CSMRSFHRTCSNRICGSYSYRTARYGSRPGNGRHWRRIRGRRCRFRRIWFRTRYVGRYLCHHASEDWSSLYRPSGKLAADHHRCRTDRGGTDRYPERKEKSIITTENLFFNVCEAPGALHPVHHHKNYIIQGGRKIMKVKKLIALGLCAAMVSGMTVSPVLAAEDTAEEAATEEAAVEEETTEESADGEETTEDAAAEEETTEDAAAEEETTAESADAAGDPTAQFERLTANEAYEFPMMVKSF